jgi:hypothetical protein
MSHLVPGARPQPKKGLRQAGLEALLAFKRAVQSLTLRKADFFLVGPSAVSALGAFKHMNHSSAFRFHDRPDKSELCSAETAVMVRLVAKYGNLLSSKQLHGGAPKGRHRSRSLALLTARRSLDRPGGAWAITPPAPRGHQDRNGPARRQGRAWQRRPSCLV